MSNKRITRADLDNVARRICRETNSPESLYNAEGDFNIGCFFVESGYGGFRLSRVTTAKGCDRDVLNQGYMPAKQLQSHMFAFIQGIYFARENIGAKK